MSEEHRRRPPVGAGLNGNDRQRTPKQHNHLHQFSNRSKNRTSTSAPEKVSIDLTTPPGSPLRRREDATPLRIKGTGAVNTPIEFQEDDDEHPVTTSRVFSRYGLPTNRPASQRNSIPGTGAKQPAYQTPKEPQKSPAKTIFPTESPPVYQVKTNHVRKQKPVPNPVTLDQLAKPPSARTDSDGRINDVGDDEGSVVQNESYSLGKNKQPQQARNDPREGSRNLNKRPSVKSTIRSAKQSQAAGLSSWPQCSACRAAGEICDGEQPCAYCGDVEDCDNPVKVPTTMPATPQSSDKQCANTMSSSVPPSSLETGGTPSDDKSEAGSVLDEVLFDLDFFEQRVLKFEKEMTDYQEYLVQGILSQNRTAARRTNGPDLHESKKSPFAQLKPLASESAKKLCLLIRDGQSSGAANKQPPSKLLESSVTTIPSDVQSLPRYKSIGRLGPLPLTRNVTIGKYNPYFPEDEALDETFRQRKYDEVKEQYKSYEAYSETIHSQRDCAELSAMWHPFVLDLLDSLQIDVTSIAAFFDTNVDLGDIDFSEVRIPDAAFAACVEAQTDTCGKCNLGLEPTWDLQDAWDKGEKASDLSPRSYAIAGLLSYAFHKITGLKLWHVIRDDASLREDLKPSGVIGRAQATNGSVLCLVCGLTNCPSHGSYNQGEDLNKDRVLINDPEAPLNIHKMAIRPKPAASITTRHTCSVWCVEGIEPDGSALRGLHPGNAVRGAFRNEREDSRSSFKPEACCGRTPCFWEVEGRKVLFEDPNRPRTKTDLTGDQQKAFENCLEMFLGNERGPCMATDFIPGVTCVNIFFLMLNETRAMPHQAVLRLQASSITGISQKPRAKGKRKAKHDTAKVEERPVFRPCDHEGVCQGNVRCTCFRNNVECEYMCGCDHACDRRFPGCRCRAGPSQVCVENSCECWTSSRECDPWLCGSCGVVEVLDQANKYKDEVRNGRCKNNRIQLGLPARTIKAPSEVQGYGLFAGEDISRNGFIGEYRGEVLSRKESDRRGITYHLSGLEYLFNLNKDQEIDASSFGNKTRFMNNSSDERNINVLGATMLCNGVNRVMLYTKRDIKAGEELLYDYGYPDRVREKFWERGQESASKNAMIVAPGSKRATGKGAGRGYQRNANGRRLNANNSSEDSDEEGRQSPAQKKQRKRKYADLDGTVNVEDVVDINEQLPFVNASDDSDFDGTTNHSVADSEEEDLGVAESSSEADADGSTPRGKTRRKAGFGDRRRGGEAQQRAWRTRKERLARP